MEGDFSRGHRPDGKRGKTYRRVLIEQGAALLDSDLAALVEAGEGLLREAVRHTACRAGASDLGFLVTPGELLALFDPVQGSTFETTGATEARRDFSRKYLDRLPGLRITGTGGSASVALRRPLDGATALRLWLRADGGATAVVNGTAITIPAGSDYAAFELTASGTTLSFAPDPAGTYWVGMVETRAAAGPAAALHWAGGSYQIDGVIAATEGAAWPGLPAPAGPAMVTDSEAPSGTRFAAYLEISERHVTGVEDPGIVEQALGGDHDTTTRSAVQAQVKLAAVPGAATPESIAAAIAAPALPDGSVSLGVAAATPTADPCDLPVPGGYTGPENRLYRLAVHSVSTAGGGETVFKWSRDNGAELFPVAFPERPAPSDPVDSLIVGASLPLRDGDLIELRSEATELGDAAPGAVGSAGFTRPARAQGRLLRLSGGEQVTGANRVFTFRDPFTEAPVATIDPAPFGEVGLKVRRWTGLIRRAGTGPAAFDLEHGIQAEVDGRFEPGDWWHYEARTATANANGPEVTAPHGPERHFAPLALLEATPAGQPMTLLAWLDTRYRTLCELEADAVAYDGARAGTEADTVQEALDELYLRVSDGCGEIAVPLGADIQDVIDAIPEGESARICLNAGTRDLPARVRVADKGDLIIGGIGGGTLLRSAGRQVFEFENCRSVTLRDFAVAVTGTGGAILSFTNCGEITIEGLRIESQAEAAFGNAAIRSQGPTRRVTITGNRIELGAADTGVLLIDPGHTVIRDNVIATRPDPFDIVAAIAAESGNDAPLAAAFGNVLIDRIDFHGDDDFDFVGGAVLSTNNPGPARLTRRGIVFANGLWGRSVLSITTDTRLSSRNWEDIAEANAAPFGRTTVAITMRAFLRRFRRDLARAALRLPTDRTVTIPSSVRPALDGIAGLLAASNQVIHGTAGIVVALNDTAFRSPATPGSISRLFPQGPGQTIAVTGNHVSGFRQGIRVGASRDRNLINLIHSVDVNDNHVELRLPMQAYQRHGIFVGHALTARVTGNRIEDPSYDPTFHSAEAQEREPVDCDGIRLWGVYGPLVQVIGNLSYGVTVGIRYQNVGSPDPNLGQATVQNARIIADNAYVGDGSAQIGSP